MRCTRTSRPPHTAARRDGWPRCPRCGAARRWPRALLPGPGRAVDGSRRIPSDRLIVVGAAILSRTCTCPAPRVRDGARVSPVRLLLEPREVVHGHAGDPGELTADGDAIEVGADRLDAESGVDGGRPRLEGTGGLIETRELRPRGRPWPADAEEVVPRHGAAVGAVVAAGVHDTVGHADADYVAVEAGLPVQRAVLHVQAEGGAAVARARREQRVPVLGHLDDLERAVREARGRDERRRAAIGERYERAVRRVHGADADAAVTARTDCALLE